MTVPLFTNEAVVGQAPGAGERRRQRPSPPRAGDGERATVVDRRDLSVPELSLTRRVRLVRQRHGELRGVRNLVLRVGDLRHDLAGVVERRAAR